MRLARKVRGAACYRAAALGIALLGLLALTAPASAQWVMMPDSANNRLVLFDPFDGSVVNPNAFPLAAGTPVHALQVGNEIWVSEQLGDRISRWSMTGTSLGAITGALDNVRGMALINNTVYLTNDGTGNGAPGPSLHRYDTSGGSLGFFTLSATSGPFHVLDYRNSILVSSDSANDDIHRYSYGGASMGTFHNSTGLNFAEQMDYAENGDILVAGFSTNSVARLDPDSGAILSTFPASGARGVFQLGNGNIMWTNGSGAHIFDTATGGSTLVYSGSGRFLDLLVPEPTSLSLLAIGVLFAVSRRNR